MWKNIIAGFLLMVGVLGPLAAQSNERLDELLSQAQARLDSTAYLLMAAGALVAEDASVADSFQAAVAAGYLTAVRTPDEGVTVEDLSFLLMKTQGVPGGLEWMLLPSPRAAYRELTFLNVINSSAGPRRLVAGDEVVRTLSAVRALKGGQK